MSHPSDSHPVPETSFAPTLVGIVLLFLLGACLGHCAWKGDYVSATVCGLVLVGSCLGYWYGIWRTLGSAVAALVTVQIAQPVSSYFVPGLQKVWASSLSPQLGLLLSGVLVFALITCLFWMVGMAIFRRSSTLRRWDGYVGFVFGLANSSLIAALTLWSLLATEPIVTKIKQADSNSLTPSALVVVHRLDQLLVATNKSYVVVPLKQWNPLIELPFLRQYQNEVTNALENTANRNEPGVATQASILDRFISNPKVQKMIGQGPDSTNPIHGVEILSGHASTLVNKLLTGDVSKIK
jgi:uncharacterized membrane protein required for colicin V production